MCPFYKASRILRPRGQGSLPLRGGLIFRSVMKAGSELEMPGGLAMGRAEKAIR